LKTILERPQRLEPWEAAVLGDEGFDYDVDRAEVQRGLEHIEEMAMKIQEILESCNSIEDEADSTTSCDLYEQARHRLNEIESRYKAIMQETSRLLSLDIM
jgi:hypothetical protein